MYSRFLNLSVLLVALQVVGALAQSSSSSHASALAATSGNAVASLSSGTPTLTTPSTTSTSSSSTGAVVATGAILTPVYIQPPAVLYECQMATFSWKGPAVQKTLAIFTSSESNGGGNADILEIYTLPDVYTPLTNGTFQWNVDMPASLNIGFELYVFWNGTNGGSDDSHATTGYSQIAPGTDQSCYASNAVTAAGGVDSIHTAEILSLASQKDPWYTYSALPAATNGATAGSGSSSSGGSSSIAGPVAGGVVGGVAVIAIVAALLFWLKRRQEREAAGAELGSQWGGQSEKSGAPSRYPPGVGSPALGGDGGFYIPYDQYGNPLVDVSGDDNYPPGSAAGTEEPRPPIRQMAAPGTLPEPMDADSVPRDAGTRLPPPCPPFDPVSPGDEIREQQAGSEGLEDPSAFTQRSTHGLDDPSSFSPAGSQR